VKREHQAASGNRRVLERTWVLSQPAGRFLFRRMVQWCRADLVTKSPLVVLRPPFRGPRPRQVPVCAALPERAHHLNELRGPGNLGWDDPVLRTIGERRRRPAGPSADWCAPTVVQGPRSRCPLGGIACWYLAYDRTEDLVVGDQSQRCGNFAGIGCALLCFVVLTCNGRPLASG
jgi:hypothetical protein